MSTYTINKSDGTTLVTVPEATINTTACSLALVGRRAVSYGELLAENFVRLSENFAHTVAPNAPLTGQFWYDKSSSTLKIYGGTEWKAVFNASANSTVSAEQLVSTATTGTSPFSVNSTTKVTNLNADYVDGYSADATSAANTLVVRDANGDIFANIFHGIATSAKYADVAERFATSTPVEAGDVVEIGGDAEIEKAHSWGGSALGVVSTAPAFRMNEDAGTDETHPFVAFVGRVPCKVLGQVRKGDRVSVSQQSGVAEKSHGMAFVIGRALEDKTDDGVGKVMIVVGVK